MPSEEHPFYAALAEDDPIELYERAPCGYVSAMPDGRLVKVNQTFLDWTGYQRTDVVRHRRIQDLLDPGGRIFWETHVAPLLRMQGTVREIATELVCVDGRRLPVFMNVAAQRGDDGDMRMIRAVLFDATERRAYEQELLTERRRAREAEARARALAETLQASFLPPAILDIPGLDVAGAYRPAGDGSEVGGDFYDVFETGRGAWGVVMGDVSGKGATAAAVTALARYTLRAEALRSPYPSAVLSALHDALCRHHPDRFCTTVFLVLDRFGDGFRLAMSSGGHHLPILLREGALQHVGTAGTILGMLDQVSLTDTTLALHPGDTIVLYTDGVTEARRGDTFLDEEGLEEIIRRSASLDAQGIADAIVASVVEFQFDTPRDDIAVLVLKVPA